MRLSDLASSPLTGSVAHAIGLVPLAWCAWLRIRGRSPDAAYWYIALALGLSWIADSWAHVTDPWLPSIVYPALQAAMIGAVLPVTRREAVTLTLVLAAAGVAGMVWWHGDGPDVFVHTVSYLAVVGLVLRVWRQDRLRVALLVLFGGMWVTWLGIAAYPAISRSVSWLAFQAVRLVGAVLVCRAIREPSRPLTALRGGVRAA